VECLLPEFLNLLSPGEEPVAKKLVDSERETVIQLGLLKFDWKGRDKRVLDHQFLRCILDDVVILVDRTCGESRGLLLLRQFSCLHHRASVPDGVETGDLCIPCELCVLVFVLKFNIGNVHLKKGSEGNLLKITVAEFNELEHFDLHKLMGVHEPQLDFHAVPVLSQSGELLEDKPSALLALL